jgi:hypothetical protein
MDFDTSNGPFTVEWGTRAEGNLHEQLDDYPEAEAFVEYLMENETFDFLCIRDADGNERRVK